MVKQQLRIELDVINQTHDLGALEYLEVNDSNGIVAGTGARIPLYANQTTMITPPFILTTPGNYSAQISLCEILLESEFPSCRNHEPAVPISSMNIVVNSTGYVAPSPSQSICANDLLGNVWVNYGSCHSGGTPTILSQSNGLSPGTFQGLIDYDRKIYNLSLIHESCEACSDSFISQFCSYDTSGNLIIQGFSNIQKQVLEDLNKNYSLYICPFKGTPAPASQPPTSPKEVTGYAGTNSISPTCQEGQVLVDNLCVEVQTTCPQGFDLQNGICVSPTESCPSGYGLEDGKCYSITEECGFDHCLRSTVPLSCTQGSIDLGNQCIPASEVQPTPPMTCPSGFGFQDHSCVGLSSLPSEECPSGTILQNKKCVLPNTQIVTSVQKLIKNATTTTPNETSIQKINNMTLAANETSTQKIPKFSLLSPIKQFRSGILIQNVKCKQDLVLIIKTENNSPACVTVSAEEKLIQYGWGYYAKINLPNWHDIDQNGILPSNTTASVNGSPSRNNSGYNHSYKTEKDGVTIVTNNSICVPTQTATNGAMDRTSFDVVSIDFPSTGEISLDGVTTLSSSKGATTIPFPRGTLNGHYNLATNSTIINCGIAYCKGENCNPNKELRTTNTSVFVNDTKGFCPVCNPKEKTCPMIACRGPYTSTDTSISAPSPSMESGIPYVYKFYLVDSSGKYEEWFFGLEYKPQ